jgi:hypothetical protein
MVPDPDALADVFMRRLGLPEQPPTARQNFENHPWIAHFMQVHPSLAVAPTTLEPQCHVEWANSFDPFFEEFLESLRAFQGPHRPIKAHATVLCSSDINETIDRCVARGVPIRIAQWSDRLQWDRFWLGVTPENPRYDPTFDGGLMIEVIPTAGIAQLLGGLEAPPEPETQPGEMVRMVNRGFLVRDVDRTLRALSSSLDIEPSGPVTYHDDEGYRRARIRFGLANSSTLDLVQPTRRDCALGYYLHVWGPGPHYARIAVDGLDAKADDLSNRGVRFDIREESSAVGRRVCIESDDLDGAVIEFVEWER